jgi:hypothetical protein
MRATGDSSGERNGRIRSIDIVANEAKLRIVGVNE